MSKQTDRIAALLAKAERTTSAEEAQAFTAKATSLMVKYGIEMAEIAAAQGDGRRDEQITTQSMRYTGGYCKADLYGAFFLASAVTDAQYSYRTRNHTRANDETLHVTGFESDVFAITTLAASLRMQAHTAMRQWWKSERIRYTAATESHKFNARRNFLWGFYKEATERVRAARVQATAEAGSGAEVALLDRAALVRDHEKNSGLRLRKSRGAQMGASSAGREAGRRADIGSSRIGGRGLAIGA